MELSLQALMDTSGVRFGTSGARGPVTAMTDRVCYAYTVAFLQYLEAGGSLPATTRAVAIGGDLRPSTERIMAAVARAAVDRGYRPQLCGRVPSPALALYGIQEAIPAIMVTGSHIPVDRNGIKFNTPAGEILKADEAGIRAQTVRLDESLWDEGGAFVRPIDSAGWPTSNTARQRYLARYLEAFPPDCLAGLRLAVYQHSAVGRDLLVAILEGLGAEVTPRGRSESFVAVDTEAIRPEDSALAARWAAEGRFDAILSTDGDSDRPLIADAAGQWFRGDIAGILCARYLGADSVSTPVSCNTAVERCAWFPEVRRTRIGSPYVVASMVAARDGGARAVVGYEANGGFLTQTDIPLDSTTLPALPTRDPVIVHLGLLLLARRRGTDLAGLRRELPQRFTASDRLQGIDPRTAQAILARFDSGDAVADRDTATAIFATELGDCREIDRTDGVRLTFASGKIVHLRPSGNAPEFRCYTEADTADDAETLCRTSLATLRRIAAGAA